MTFQKKLSDSDVIAIRSEYCFNEPNASLRSLARRYQVSYQTILHAVRYLTYKRPKGECHGRPSTEPCSAILKRNAPTRLSSGDHRARDAHRNTNLALQPHVLGTDVGK
jgi:DNA-binding transcriptional MocR family regulator